MKKSLEIVHGLNAELEIEGSFQGFRLKFHFNLNGIDIYSKSYFDEITKNEYKDFSKKSSGSYSSARNEHELMNFNQAALIIEETSKRLAKTQNDLKNLLKENDAQSIALLNLFK